jgi:hypothetical protein
VNPVAHLHHALITRRQAAERALCEAIETIGLAIPTGIEVSQHAERKLAWRNLEHRGRIFSGMAELNYRFNVTLNSPGGAISRKYRLALSGIVQSSVVSSGSIRKDSDVIA